MSHDSEKRRVLHLLTRPNDELAETVLRRQREFPSLDVRSIALHGGEPDYNAVLNEIFAADSIQVW